MSFVFRVFHVHGVSKTFFHFDQSDHSHFCNKSEEFSSALSFLGLPHSSQEGEQNARVQRWWCSQEGLWHGDTSGAPVEHPDLCEQSSCQIRHGVGMLWDWAAQEGRGRGWCGARLLQGSAGPRQRGGASTDTKKGGTGRYKRGLVGGCRCRAAGRGQHAALISRKAPL